MNVRAKRGFETQRQLATRGMHAAIDIRAQQQLDYKSPICIYGLCEALGVTVRFNDINMEGMYDGGAKPRIHVSALRPFGRRAFTCAHELGHHVFGHGSTIDELRDEQAQSESRPPNEVIADAFAAHLLMPALGIRDAFIKRGLNPNTASATEIYAVACNFGVGQATLVNHMAYALSMITPVQRATLGKITPKMIRTQLLGESVAEPLILADQHWTSPVLDMEVGGLVLMPAGVVVDTAMLMPERALPSGRQFRAARTGITRVAVPGTSWATYIRIARPRYVGLARYRHLEDGENE